MEFNPFNISRALAQTGKAEELIAKINDAIVNPLIFLFFGIALIAFLWGMLEFISGANSEDKIANGRRHMIWGVVGMFIMMSVFGIMNLICNTIGC